jgi:BASS family bile acid:Na+ symporter
MRAVIEEAVKISLAVLIPLAAFATGADAPARGTPRLWNRPALLARALAAILIVVPLFAVVVLKVLPLSPIVRGGVLVAVLAVGIGPVAVMRRSKAPGYEAVDLNLVVMLVSLVYVPVGFAVLAHAFNRQLHLAVFPVEKVILSRALVPMLLGIVVARSWPRIAASVQPALAKLVNTALPVLLVFLLFFLWHSVRSVNAAGFAACAVVAAGAVAIGHLLGGPDRRTRAVVANASAMRFPILGLTLAAALPQSDKVVSVVVVYLLMAMVALLVYAVLMRQASSPRRGGVAKYATA